MGRQLSEIDDQLETEVIERRARTTSRVDGMTVSVREQKNPASRAGLGFAHQG